MRNALLALGLVACGGPRSSPVEPATNAPIVTTTARLPRGIATRVRTIEATFTECIGERYRTSPDGPEKHAVTCEVRLSAGSRGESWSFMVDAPFEESLAQRPAALERVFEGVRLRIVGLQVDRDPMHLDIEHTGAR